MRKQLSDGSRFSFIGNHAKVNFFVISVAGYISKSHVSGDRRMITETALMKSFFFDRVLKGGMITSHALQQAAKSFKVAVPSMAKRDKVRLF